MDQHLASGARPFGQRFPSNPPITSGQKWATRAFDALGRFLHIEAVSGIVLLCAAAAALLWANGPFADSYDHFWHMPVALEAGGISISRSLHFWINDGLMTVFFLVVGMEIRREIHDGALRSLSLAALPLVAALGGILAPAALYMLLAGGVAAEGWAVPTATDIAFAVGVLALLGKRIPASARVFLLALAVIDDLAAVVIITLFYSSGLDPAGFLWAGLGIAMIFGMRHLGIGSALAYVLPGAILWFGVLATGAHPTLAGVLLGLMTPVAAVGGARRPLARAWRAMRELRREIRSGAELSPDLVEPARSLRRASDDMLPPLVRVQAVLHPWVAYGVMPLFALANAGVRLDGAALPTGELLVMAGIFLGLVLGKPLGVAAACWMAMKTGLCRLPDGMDWRMVWLVACLTGIGFTMSIFIGSLAFADPVLLNAAKLGVLLASVTAGIVGLGLGGLLVKGRAAD
ncbi:MAG TPA: Na+/H+ antiporter NhaA [Sphingomonadales bacterium]